MNSHYQLQLEKKLRTLRSEYSEQLRQENVNLQNTVSELKQAHEEQLSELKISQAKEIDRMQQNDDHTTDEPIFEDGGPG